MKLYHVSDHAETILQSGFSDGDGFYREGKLHRGVWLYDRPVEEGIERLGDPRTIVVEIPDDVAVRHEWLEEGGSHRKFLIPARIVNRYLGNTD